MNLGKQACTTFGILTLAAQIGCSPDSAKKPGSTPNANNDAASTNLSVDALKDLSAPAGVVTNVTNWEATKKTAKTSVRLAETGDAPVLTVGPKGISAVVGKDKLDFPKGTSEAEVRSLIKRFYAIKALVHKEYGVPVGKELPLKANFVEAKSLSRNYRFERSGDKVIAAQIKVSLPFKDGVAIPEFDSGCVDALGGSCSLVLPGMFEVAQSCRTKIVVAKDPTFDVTLGKSATSIEKRIESAKNDTSFDFRQTPIKDFSIAIYRASWIMGQWEKCYGKDFSARVMAASRVLASDTKPLKMAEFVHVVSSLADPNALIAGKSFDAWCSSVNLPKAEKVVCSDAVWAKAMAAAEEVREPKAKQ